MTAIDYAADDRSGEDASGDRATDDRTGHGRVHGDRVSDDRNEDASSWHRRRWTTIVLESDGDGWRATQTGVDAEGRGATAADAAAAYCRRVSESGADETGGRLAREECDG